MRTLNRYGIIGLLLTTTCALFAGRADAVASASDAQLGGVQNKLTAGSVLYFRCTATSWGVDDVSRLKPTNNLDLFTLPIQPREEWMTTGGDSCAITETPLINAWGNWQVYYYANSPVFAGGGLNPVLGGSSNPQNFTVMYPSLGAYQVLLSRANLLFTIAQAPPAIVATPIAAPLYYGGQLSTLSPDQASSYGEGNHPPYAVVSVRHGLPDLGDHFGIVVDDFLTYGLEHWTFEFDFETGTAYEQLVWQSGSPQSVYRIVPPAQGGDAAKYREILQKIEAKLVAFAQGQLPFTGVAIFPVAQLQRDIDYIDAILAKLN